MVGAGDVSVAVDRLRVGSARSRRRGRRRTMLDDRQRSVQLQQLADVDPRSRLVRAPALLGLQPVAAGVQSVLSCRRRKALSSHRVTLSKQAQTRRLA